MFLICSKNHSIEIAMTIRKPLTQDMAPADEDVAEQMLAFLLRCAWTKRSYDDPRQTSEITAKRVIAGLKRSGYILMKNAPQTPVPQEAHGQMYLL
jgi:hypothetical protein